MAFGRFCFKLPRLNNRVWQLELLRNKQLKLPWNPSPTSDSFSGLSSCSTDRAIIGFWRTVGNQQVQIRTTLSPNIPEESPLLAEIFRQHEIVEEKTREGGLSSGERDALTTAYGGDFGRCCKKVIDYIEGQTLCQFCLSAPTEQRPFFSIYAYNWNAQFLEIINQPMAYRATLNTHFCL